MHNRHTSRRRLTAGGLIAALATATLIAATIQPGQGAAPAPSGNRHVIDKDGRALSTYVGKSKLATVKHYLASRGADASTLKSLNASGSSWTYRGVTHLRLDQKVSGLRVHGAEAKASFNAKGQLVHLIDFTARVGSDAAAAKKGSAAALKAAVKSLYPSRSVDTRETDANGKTTTYAKGTKFLVGPRVERVAIPGASGLKVGYLVDTWDAGSNAYYSTLVSGSGDVKSHELRTAKDQYNVFTNNPDATPQTIVEGPGTGNDESPIGWLFSQLHTSIDISGNNVHAYLDRDAKKNKPDAGGDLINDGSFVTDADLTEEPTTEDNQEVGVQNLFYLNNVIHDTLYAAGFVEAAGNFQEDSFGRALPSTDSDSVEAEAQDGGGLDNANFATPPDGVNPRMQMYLWTGLGTHEVVIGGTSYVAQGAAWGPALDTTGVTGPLAVGVDGVAAVGNACETLIGDYAGKVVIVDRGACDFTVKAKNVQTAGGVGVIVANNNGSAPFTMGGADASVSIPGVMVSQVNGAAIKAAVGSSTTIKLADEQPLKRDGDVDSDIVWHEYGHGLTWRMIGKMSGPLAGAIGEGMGDVLALIANEDDVVGEYSTTDPFGIRSMPYDNYNLTYGDIVGAEVHADGEVYAAIGWRLLEHYQGAGIDKSVLLADLVDGMNYTPREPTYEEMRDGILDGLEMSDGTDRSCMVWDAFAEYGVGVGAHGVANGKTATTVESFDLPVECQA